jgi:hypothetical protein
MVLRKGTSQSPFQGATGYLTVSKLVLKRFWPAHIYLGRVPGLPRDIGPPGLSCPGRSPGRRPAHFRDNRAFSNLLSNPVR